MIHIIKDHTGSWTSRITSLSLLITPPQQQPTLVQFFAGSQNLSHDSFTRWRGCGLTCQRCCRWAWSSSQGASFPPLVHSSSSCSRGSSLRNPADETNPKWTSEHSLQQRAWRRAALGLLGTSRASWSSHPLGKGGCLSRYRPYCPAWSRSRQVALLAAGAGEGGTRSMNGQSLGYHTEIHAAILHKKHKVSITLKYKNDFIKTIFSFLK